MITRCITGIILISYISFLFSYDNPVYFSALLVIMMIIMITELRSLIKSSYLFYPLVIWYPIIPCCMLIYCNQINIYQKLLYYLLLIVASFDTASYFIGTLASRWRTTIKIIPKISPAKSIEGFLGGYTISLFLFNSIINQQSLLTYILHLCLCLTAFIGDIFESSIKRSAGVKDSGSLLPGHGGLLDRCDAILFVTYIFFILKKYLIFIFK